MRFLESGSPDLRIWSWVFNSIHRVVVRNDWELLPASICASNLCDRLIGWVVTDSLRLFVDLWCLVGW